MRIVFNLCRYRSMNDLRLCSIQSERIYNVQSMVGITKSHRLFTWDRVFGFGSRKLYLRLLEEHFSIFRWSLFLFVGELSVSSISSSSLISDFIPMTTLWGFWDSSFVTLVFTCFGIASRFLLEKTKPRIHKWLEKRCIKKNPSKASIYWNV